MPVLDNPRHELFAQAIALGKSNREAYRSAGYDPETDEAVDASASRLLSDARVQARVSELLSRAAANTEVTIERVNAELARIGFANMLDYMRVGEDGSVSLDFSGMDREKAAAVQEIIVEEGNEKAPKKVRFKLADKKSSLELLGKHLGMFKERVEHTGANGGPIETKDMSGFDIARRIAFALASATPQKDEP